MAGVLHLAIEHALVLSAGTPEPHPHTPTGLPRELGAAVVIDDTAGPWDAGIEPVDFVVVPDRRHLGIAALLDGGWARPAIDSLFPLEQAASAFECSMAADKRGEVAR